MNKMPVPSGGYKPPYGRAGSAGEPDADDTKKTGKFRGKSNVLGHGGRAAQLKAKGVPEAVIGAIARAKGAAAGQANYHPSKGKGGKK
jgi:hypothetical protein